MIRNSKVINIITHTECTIEVQEYRGESCWISCCESQNSRNFYITYIFNILKYFSMLSGQNWTCFNKTFFPTIPKTLIIKLLPDLYSDDKKRS